ncbi:unnamed protein product [Cylicocyclus nassatus]|uniref:Uncharacterized protein n=1 Tax=Cylicocyclus nassatus TaxID=53992 RepID=A0AA36DKN2_CYLNA|nr:unnamed protein product [Cylicocyclus nassatus]
MADFGVLLLGLLLTVPFFTDYFGYIYLVNGHYWYFDFNKPYTYLYNSLNLILQVPCSESGKIQYCLIF